MTVIKIGGGGGEGDGGGGRQGIKQIGFVLNFNLYGV